WPAMFPTAARSGTAMHRWDGNAVVSCGNRPLVRVGRRNRLPHQNKCLYHLGILAKMYKLQGQAVSPADFSRGRLSVDINAFHSGGDSAKHVVRDGARGAGDLLGIERNIALAAQQGYYVTRAKARAF